MVRHGRTFIHNAGVELDNHGVANDVAEKARRVFALALADVAVLHRAEAGFAIRLGDNMASFPESYEMCTRN